MDRQSNLVDVLESLKARPKIMVIGDLILDRYTYGASDRISPEAPVIVLKANECEHRLGGAASVCHMLATLGAEVCPIGVVGDDQTGKHLRDHFHDYGIQTDTLETISGRPTTLKERFVGRSGSGLPSQILRVDTESNEPISESIERRLIASVSAFIQGSDAVLISDYVKGVCTAGLLQAAISQARELNIPVLVDPGRDQDYSIYRNATLLKPNRTETQLATGLNIKCPDDALDAGQSLCEQLNIDMAVLTLDADGMCLSHASGKGAVYPTSARSVYDITGAGDMVLSVLGICLASGSNADDAIQLANIGAGLEIDRIGVAVLTRDEIKSELLSTQGLFPSKQLTIQRAASAAEEYRRKNKSVVFTNGCFDLLHVGHVTYLEEAAALGDILVVGVNSDCGVQRLKGPDRPIISESDRVAMLASLACVDHVILFDADTPCEILQAIRPDVLVKGGTYTKEEVVGHELVEEYGGRVCVTGVVGGVSTTKIVDSLHERKTLRRAG